MRLWHLLTARPYLAASIAAHGLLLAWLAQYGSYESERRIDTEVAASVQATANARMARRLEDLRKIKELLEESANRKPEPLPAEVADEPKDPVQEARELAHAIDELGRDLKAEEQARLTGQTVEEARAEVAKQARNTPVATDPASEVDALEQQARAVLAERAAQLQHQQDGVPLAQSESDGDGLGRMAALLDDDAAPQHISTLNATGIRQRSVITSRYPQVDSKTMVKGQGRMLGAGGAYANRVYLNSWYLIGPFPGYGSGPPRLRRYPPEDAVLLDATYYGKDKRALKWEYVSESSYPLVPRHAADDAIYYGYTEVLMDQDRDLKVWIGADDDIAVKINGRTVWGGGNLPKRGVYYDNVYYGAGTTTRDYNRTEVVRVVRFRKGRNTVFFKLSNGPVPLFVSIVLTPA